MSSFAHAPIPSTFFVTPGPRADDGPEALEASLNDLLESFGPKELDMGDAQVARLMEATPGRKVAALAAAVRSARFMERLGWVGFWGLGFRLAACKVCLI